MEGDPLLLDSSVSFFFYSLSFFLLEAESHVSQASLELAT